jgi:hypothetical protein
MTIVLYQKACGFPFSPQFFDDPPDEEDLKNLRAGEWWEELTFEDQETASIYCRGAKLIDELERKCGQPLMTATELPKEGKLAQQLFLLLARLPTSRKVLALPPL